MDKRCKALLLCARFPDKKVKLPRATTKLYNSLLSKNLKNAAKNHLEAPFRVPSNNRRANIVNNISSPIINRKPNQVPVERFITRPQGDVHRTSS